MAFLQSAVNNTSNTDKQYWKALVFIDQQVQLYGLTFSAIIKTKFHYCNSRKATIKGQLDGRAFSLLYAVNQNPSSY